MEWTHSPFRFLSSEDSDSVLCPHTPAPSTAPPATAGAVPRLTEELEAVCNMEEDAALYMLLPRLSKEQVLSWPSSCNDPLDAVFGSSLLPPRDSFGQMCQLYLQSFRSDIFRAVDVIESGGMDPVLCHPCEDPQGHDDVLEPLMNLKLATDDHQPSRCWRASSSAPDTPRTPSTPFATIMPRPSSSMGSRPNDMGTDMGTLSSARFPAIDADHAMSLPMSLPTKLANAKLYAALTADLSDSMHLEPLSQPLGHRSTPPAHSAPLPLLAPGHLLSSSVPLYPECTPAQPSLHRPAHDRQPNTQLFPAPTPLNYSASFSHADAPLRLPTLDTSLTVDSSYSTLLHYGQSDPGLPPPAIQLCTAEFTGLGDCPCDGCLELLLTSNIMDLQPDCPEPAASCANSLLTAGSANATSGGRLAQRAGAASGSVGRSPFAAPARRAKKAPQHPKLTKIELRQLFQLPIEEARKVVGVPKNAFKKIMSECGFERWPQRQLVGLQRLMDNTNADTTLKPGAKQARLGRIKLNICALMDGVVSSIYPDLQKISHVYHNRQHQVRSTRREPDCPTSSEEPTGSL